MTRCPLGLPQDAAKLIMKSLSCSCGGEWQHFNLVVIKYENKAKLNIEDIPAQILKNIEKDVIAQNTTRYKSNTESENMAGPSSIQQYNDYVLVKFPVRKMEYRYAAIINQIDNEEGEITVTFIKICDDKCHTF
ncbi:hypothetical protein HHI36_012852 [Cryptolaemus montrouzieri]|uniref:Uncharacterized protein n=1 Tax=Cryptolaemus montrouzieri TaxID=559131 RepID=A0ABD2NFE5_9CUCU